MNKYRRLTKGGITTVVEAIADPACKTPPEASKKGRNGPVRHPEHRPGEEGQILGPVQKEGGGADQQGVPKQKGTRPQRVPIHQAKRGQIDT